MTHLPGRVQNEWPRAMVCLNHALFLASHATRPDRLLGRLKAYRRCLPAWGSGPKPIYPLSTQMPFDPDLIDRWFTRIGLWVEFVWHNSVPVVAANKCLCHMLNVWGSMPVTRCSVQTLKCYVEVLFWMSRGKVEEADTCAYNKPSSRARATPSVRLWTCSLS